MKKYTLLCTAVFVIFTTQSIQRVATRVIRLPHRFQPGALECTAAASRALSTLPPKIAQQNEPSGYKKWGYAAGAASVGIAGAYGLTQQNAQQDVSPAQTMHAASVWAELDQKGALSKHQMLNSYIHDCAQYSSENAHIPKHIKNDNTVRIMTYNVFGWRNVYEKNNFNGILKVIDDIQPDVLVLQEVSLFDERSIKNEFNKRGYNYSAFCNTVPNKFTPFGTQIFSKYPLSETQEITFQADSALNSIEKRGYIETVITLPHHQQLTLYATHLDVWDNSGELRKKEITELLNKIKTKKGNYIIAGDFNSVRAQDYNYSVNGKKVWDILTASTLKRTGLPSSTGALDLIEKYGFVDSFSKHSVPTPRFTVWSGTAVDFIYLNKQWKLPILGSYVHYNVESDHLPVIMDIATQD